MKRSDTWPTRELPAYLKSAMSRTFEWGVYDCCLFAADAVQAMTGEDIASEFRDAYTDERSAFVAIRKITGGSTVEDACAYVASKHGLAEWLHGDDPCPLKAQRGDLCAVSNDGTIIAGIVEMSGRYVACMTDKGYVRLPLSSIKRAWHV